MIEKQVIEVIIKKYRKDYISIRDINPFNSLKILYNYVQNLRILAYLNKNNDENKYAQIGHNIMILIRDYEKIVEKDFKNKSLYEKRIKQKIKEIEIEFDFM